VRKEGQGKFSETFLDLIYKNDSYFFLIIYKMHIKF
jgi:hypothetical protein